MSSKKKLNKVFTAFYQDFYIKIRRVALEKCSAAWNLGIKSRFSLGPTKTMKNLNRCGPVVGPSELQRAIPYLNRKPLTFWLLKFI
jgi:hypothetical protein